MPARQAYTNRLKATTATVTVSSEQSGFTRTQLADQSPGYTWRSKAGWNVVAGVNDKIDFNKGGVLAATISAGNYSTSAAYAAAVVAALTAAVANTWTCTYNSGTGVFTIGGAAAFTLLFSSGANKATSAALDLGYTETDKGSATSQVAEGASYKSREWIKCDQTSALAVTMAVLKHHNCGSSASIRLQMHTADTAAGWLAPDVNVALTGATGIHYLYQSTQSKRYLRLLINDVATNTAGYTEVGLAYVGTYDEPSVTYSTSYEQSFEPLSTMATAISGSHKVDVRATRSVWSMSWLEVPSADRTKLRNWLLAAPLGTNFLFAFDPTNDPSNIVYGFFSEATLEQLSGNLYWTFPVRVCEVLP